MTYLALVKINVEDGPARSRTNIISDLEILAGRMVEEFGFDPVSAVQVFERCIDIVYEAGSNQDKRQR